MKYRQDITPELAVEVYERHDSVESTAKELKCAPCTIRNRLRSAGYTDPIFQVKGRWSVLTKEEKTKYWNWRNEVFTRDNGRCRVCCSDARIEPHHIRMWINYPTSRYDSGNGVTLCHECHLLVRGYEDEYVNIFLSIISDNIVVADLPAYEIPKEKECTRCLAMKALEEFAPRPKEFGSKYGRHPWCRECERQVGREKYARDSNKCKKSSRRWVLDNQEKRTTYIMRRNMETRMREGRQPSWTKARARLGLVTPAKKDWPTREVMQKIEDYKNIVKYADIGL